jgi:hypothetical protein
MSNAVLVELELPGDWKKFRMPPALQERLQELLDRQDLKGSLTARERREATGLVELSDMLTLMKARAELARRKRA